MDETPSTEEILGALRVLGVTGPATAADVLNAAGLALPTWQTAEVLNAVAWRRAGAGSGPCE